MGLTIDKKLEWKTHINTTIDTNLASLRNIISKIKSIYGPKPKLVKWAYTGIICPRLSYGVMIWGNKLRLKKHEKKL